jgi:shikimate dehydrogenase
VSGVSGIVARTPPSALVVLGQPVARSLSPVFQNAALQASQITVQYDRREVAPDELDAVLAECRARNCSGNVTMPHKAAVFERAAHRTPMAERTGAVNTFWWEDGHLMGHNTDVAGITATLRALCPRGIDGDVLVLGAGGSAAAVLVALEGAQRAAGAHTIVMARTPARGDALVRRVKAEAQVVADGTPISWSRVALVINATPKGMGSDDALPMLPALLSPHTAVFDLVYTPESTRWVNEARARGLDAEDGLRMLVEQGAAAFETWFETPAPREAMWRALGVPMPSPHAVRR